MNMNTLKTTTLKKDKWWHKRQYVITEDFIIGEHLIPKGFISDGCTILRWVPVLGLLSFILAILFNSYFFFFIAMLTVIACIPILFPTIEKGGYCCFLHDFILHNPEKFTRKEADLILKNCLKDADVKPIRYLLIILGVRFYSISKISIQKIKSLFIQ